MSDENKPPPPRSENEPFDENKKKDDVENNDDNVNNNNSADVKQEPSMDIPKREATLPFDSTNLLSKEDEDEDDLNYTKGHRDNLDERPPPIQVNFFWLLIGLLLLVVGFVTFMGAAMMLNACTTFALHGDKHQNNKCAGFKAVGSILLIVGFAVFCFGAFVTKCWSSTDKERVEPPPAGPGAPPPPPPESLPFRHELTTRTILGRLASLIGISIVSGGLLFLGISGIALWRGAKSSPDPEDHKFHVGRHRATTHLMVARDGRNYLPYAFAATERDAFFTQGFVHAQDRLAQMEVYRLASQGRMAEFVGPVGKDIDRFAKTMGFHRAGLHGCGDMDAEAYDLVKAYVDGINYFLESDKKRPPEFLFLGAMYFFHEPEPWTVEHVCTFARTVGWALVLNPKHEARRWHLFAKGNYSYDQIEEVMRDHRGDPPVVSAGQMGYSAAQQAAGVAAQAADYAAEKAMYDDATIMKQFRDDAIRGAAETPAKFSRRFEAMADEGEDGDATAAAKETQRRQAAYEDKQKNKKKQQGGSASSANKRGAHQFSELFGGLRSGIADGGGGSNIWAARAAGEPPIHANDPHTYAGSPSLWHPIKLIINGTFHVSGATVPGLPSILVGRTNDRSWGATVSYSDLADFFVMLPDPQRPHTHYLYQNESRRYIQRLERIQVKDGKDELITVYDSVYGPDLSEVMELSGRFRICLRTAILDNSAGQTLGGLVRFISPKIRTVDEFRLQALQYVDAPGLSIAMADRFGGIGLAVTGRRHPIRKPGHTGRYPVIGDGRFDYSGFVPFSALPYVIDNNATADGFVSAANNRMAPDGYPYNLGSDYAAPWRSVEITRRLNAAATASANRSLNLGSVDWHKRLQTDVTSSIWVNTLRPRMVNGSDPILGLAFTGLLTPEGVAMRDALVAWDGKAQRGSTQATLLWKWIRRLGALPSDANKLVDPDFDFNGHFDSASYAVQRVLYSGTPATSAFAITTARCVAAGRATPLASAADDPSRALLSCREFAAREFNQVARGGLQQGRWGIDLHRMQMDHFFFGGSLLSCMTDYHLNKGGDETSINIAATKPEDIDEDGSRLDVRITPNLRSITRLDSDGPVSGKHYMSIAGGVSGHPWHESYAMWSNWYVDDGYEEVPYIPTNIDARQFLLQGSP